MDEPDSELKPRSQYFEESYDDETNLFVEEKQIFIEKGMNSLHRVILTRFQGEPRQKKQSTGLISVGNEAMYL